MVVLLKSSLFLACHEGKSANDLRPSKNTSMVVTPKSPPNTSTCYNWRAVNIRQYSVHVDMLRVSSSFIYNTVCRNSTDD